MDLLATCSLCLSTGMKGGDVIWIDGLHTAGHYVLWISPPSYFLPTMSCMTNPTHYGQPNGKQLNLLLSEHWHKMEGYNPWIDNLIIDQFTHCRWCRYLHALPGRLENKIMLTKPPSMLCFYFPHCANLITQRCIALYAQL